MPSLSANRRGEQRCLVYADREGNIGPWNAGATAMFGYSAAEAMGQSLDIIIPENLRARDYF